MAIQDASSQISDNIISQPTSISGIVHLQPGVLKLSGKDAADFLNRMSTNDLSKLRKGEFATTVLTTEKGRIIDVIRVLSLDDALLVLTSEGSEAAVRHWLERYVIMEDIQFSSESASCLALNLFGEAIPAVLSIAGLGQTFPVDNVMLSLKSEGESVVAFRDELWPGTVVTLFTTGSASRLESLRGEILRSAAVIPRDTLDAYMIEAGVPAPGTEISTEHNPLECNFWRFVNFSKGCYIGQEVIARLDSYSKLQKRMTGFQFEQGVSPGPAPGMIFSGDDVSGTTTRHALSPRETCWIAIGFLKIGADPSNLTFGSEHSAGRTAIRAVTLPFTQS